MRDWCNRVGWEKVLNKASTTFKDLSDADKAGLDEEKAIALMSREPTMMKRPVLILDDTVMNGFRPAVYAEIFGKA